ncbi:hypothetical protein Vadar_000355 [Vaccinium darrowii]|uniref:Uncharacterized protein n=1 Tax=Vaccinium darrowii TaxID=229202 RepID=A0ACB7XWA8_9ERIC|nr:hypothetical protein Vadar_000355 [Vaccinium darrowii]
MLPVCLDLDQENRGDKKVEEEEEKVAGQEGWEEVVEKEEVEVVVVENKVAALANLVYVNTAKDNCEMDFALCLIRVYIKKRHSLPGANGRQGSPRVQRSSSRSQQGAKGNGPPQERKWQRKPNQRRVLSSDRRRVPIEFRLTVNVELRSTASSHQLFELRSICSSSYGQQRRVPICSTSDRRQQRVSICSSKWGFEEKEKSEYVLKEKSQRRRGRERHRRHGRQSVTVSVDRRRAVLEAMLEESACLTDMENLEHNALYGTTYTTRYEISCTKSGWKITKGAVLKSWS